MRFRTGHLKEEREGKEIKEQPILGSISFLLLALTSFIWRVHNEEDDSLETPILSGFFFLASVSMVFFIVLSIPALVKRGRAGTGMKKS